MLLKRHLPALLLAAVGWCAWGTACHAAAGPTFGRTREASVPRPNVVLIWPTTWATATWAATAIDIQDPRTGPPGPRRRPG